MDFRCRVLEAHQASRDYRNWVAFVVYPREIRHPRVKERSPNRIPNAWRPKRDSSDRRARGQIKRHKQRIEFRKSSAKRVTDLWIRPKKVGTAPRRRIMKTYQNHVSRRMLAHQSFDFCEDLVCGLHVLNHKPRVALDVTRAIRKQSRIESFEIEVQVSQNRQPVKYSVRVGYFESGTYIFFGFVPW